jgi:hypothetical protein
MPMTHSQTIRPLLAVSLIAASAASAQDTESAGPLRNRFGVSYRSGFNIDARFKRPGGLPAQSNPGPPAGRADREYDDGFVRTDSGENPGLTWNWGYQNASQVPGDDTIQFHSSSVGGSGVSKGTDDSPQHGLEFTWNRYMGNIGERVSWGFEAAFAFNNITVANGRPVTSSLNQLTDTYALDGVIPPEPPYTGTFGGPGPLISDSPSRSVTTIPNGATVSGQRSFDGDLFGIRVGPYIEVPLDAARKWNVNFSGGLAMAAITSEFRYQESTAIQDAAAVNSSGSGRDSDFMVGAYVGSNISYSFNKSWSVFAGASWQYLPDYSHKLNGRIAEITFNKSVFVNLGFGFSF